MFSLPNVVKENLLCTENSITTGYPFLEGGLVNIRKARIGDIRFKTITSSVLAIMEDRVMPR